MPMKWVESELAASAIYNDEEEVWVYHTYKNDQFDERLEYWFAMNRYEEGETDFDIREWPSYDSSKSPVENIRTAIMAGDISEEGPQWETRATE